MSGPIPTHDATRRRQRSLRQSPRRARRGLALLLVLWLVVVLGAVTMVSVASARRAGGLASNLRARAVARSSAESGVTLAVQAVAAVLATASDTGARRDALNALDRLPSLDGEIPLGQGRLVVAVHDVGTLLDVNLASDEQLARFFALFVSPTQADAATRAIRAFRERGAGPPVASPPTAPLDARGTSPVRPSRMIRTVDELRALPEIPPALKERAFPYLTVDGDGSINRRTASDTVRSVAGGELRDEPSRVVVISRGWQAGHPLTWEIQDVYAIQGNTVTFVRRRERVL